MIKKDKNVEMKIRKIRDKHSRKKVRTHRRTITIHKRKVKVGLDNRTKLTKGLSSYAELE